MTLMPDRNATRTASWIPRHLLPTMVMVGAGTAALTACGTLETVNDTSSDAAVAATRLRLDALYDAAGGDSEQRAAAEFRLNYPANNSTGSCMAEAGYDWHWYYVNLWAGATTQGGGSSNWLAPLNSRVISSALMRSARAHDQLVSISTEFGDYVLSQDPEYRQTLRGCAPKEGDVNSKQTPEEEGAESSQLVTEYTRMIGEVDADLASYEEPYRQCMAAAGLTLPRTDPEEGYPVNGRIAALSLIRAAEPDTKEIPLPGQEPSQSWQDFVAFEVQVTSADADCRRDAYADGMLKLSKLLDRFDSDHPTLLADAQNARIDDVAWAQQHGFDPTAETWISPTSVE